MRTSYRLAVFLAAVALACPAFAIKGKSLYHYIAYEAAFWPKNMPVTSQHYAQIELSGKANLPFDTLVFAPAFGFGSMAANLQSATYPSHQPQADSRWMRNYKNGMPELLKAGGDPITETVKWCRANKKEAVVALPVNLLGTHSSKPTPDHGANSWYAYLYPAFKTQNHDCLMDPDGKTAVRYGNAICVDYAQAKVRDKFTAIAAEICSKYDIDGIMVDFMHSPILFRSVATGGTAAPKEVELINQMMLKVKASCKAAAARLGHPVDLAARLPDSVGYCKDIGIDMLGLIGGKTLDWVVFGGSFQLNRWSTCGDVALKAGVPYYVSFTQSGIHVGNDSGYHGDDERLPRNSAMACNARIADALLSKASGCMFTMGMHFEVQFPRNLCVPYDAKVNRTADKRYFVSYTNDRDAGRWLKDGLKHLAIPSLLSGNPVDLGKGIAKYKIDVWDDVAALKRDGIEPKFTLVIEAVIPSGMDTIVTFNAKELKSFKRRAGTQHYELPSALVLKGANEVTVKSKGKNKRGGVATLGNISVEVVFPKGGAK